MSKPYVPLEKQVRSTLVRPHQANSCLSDLTVTACPDPKVQCPGKSRCLDAGELCDLHQDCAEGSDKAHCPQSHCLAGQWQCQNKVCVMDSWRCDGIDQCGDSSDEHVCGEPCFPHVCLKDRCTMWVALCKLHFNLYN